MENDVFKIKPKEKGKLRQILKIYIFPITVGIAFIFIVLFLVIPSVFNIFSTLEEIGLKNEIYAKNVVILNDLKTLNSTAATVQSQLESINSITTADQTEVVKFRNKITNVITENNLSIFSQQLTETDPNIISNGSSQDISLKEVPFTFRIEGSYNNIVNFFNDLGTISDFVIIKEMTFKRSADISSDGSTVWVLDLVLVKYQFNASEGLDAIYKSILPSVKISDKVLEYINKRTELIQNGN